MGTHISPLSAGTPFARSVSLGFKIVKGFVLIIGTSIPG